MKLGIKSYGAYIPKYLVKRPDIGDAWDFPKIPGTKAVANADEDSLTMGFEAGYDCLKGFEDEKIDGVFFASTTSPFLEKSSSSIIATALDLPKNIQTMDFTNSLKAGTSAFISACGMISTGKLKNVLVIASDKRNPEPASMYEYQMGDAAAAFLLSSESPVIEVIDSISTSEDLIGPWRRDKDTYVRQFSGKYDDLAGYLSNMITTCDALLKKQDIEPSSISKASIYGSDVRKPAIVGKKLGIPGKAILDNQFMTLGDTGNPQVFLTLISSLKRVKDDELILMAGYGDGVDAILMKVIDKKMVKQLKKTRRGVLIYSAMTEAVKNYNKYLFFRNSLGKEPFTRQTSTVTIHRDSEFILRMHGMKCRKCGTVQYPIWRSCIEPTCMATDDFDIVKLKRKGKIFTFTLDHLEGGDYFETPIPRCVIDLDGGGRIFLNMTDITDPKDVKIGMEVELTLRKIHEGADFYNYYYKCRPVRERSATVSEGSE
ncbi:MAG: OB-fold domain-containing protein [Promethearchaeota archaeon]